VLLLLEHKAEEACWVHSSMHTAAVQLRCYL